MGSSSSHLGPRPRASRPRRIISSLICGGSSSRDMDDHPEAEHGITLGRRDLAMNESERSTKDSSMLPCTETGFWSTIEESGSTSVSRLVETHNPENYVPESNNLARPYQTSGPVNVLAQTNGGSVESLVHNSTDGPLLSVSDQSLNADPVEDESVHQLNVVSVSSIISPISNADIMSIREARRNSRRLFWDAFSRRNSRRHTDTTPTTVHSNDDDTDDLGSHGRWLHDFNGDFLDDGVGSDSGYLGSRLHRMNERRRHSRSEIWERIRSGFDDNGLRTAYCPSGVHPDGTCSCDSFLMTEESSTHASITRIVMLTEALFEVLDEIHRQPLTFSLSMVSLPAPESVVNSFPVKYHKTLETDDCRDDIQQCYICLGEYEEGDKIRVLPCHHEYHMSCVDKWLKEIHGVCPLCRGDVCQGINQCSSNSNLESLSLQ